MSKTDEQKYYAKDKIMNTKEYSDFLKIGLNEEGIDEIQMEFEDSMYVPHLKDNPEYLKELGYSAEYVKELQSPSVKNIVGAGYDRFVVDSYGNKSDYVSTELIERFETENKELDRTLKNEKILNLDKMSSLGLKKLVIESKKIAKSNPNIPTNKISDITETKSTAIDFEKITKTEQMFYDEGQLMTHSEYSNHLMANSTPDEVKEVDDDFRSSIYNASEDAKNISKEMLEESGFREKEIEKIKDPEYTHLIGAGYDNYVVNTYGNKEDYVNIEFLEKFVLQNKELDRTLKNEKTLNLIEMDSVGLKKLAVESKKIAKSNPYEKTNTISASNNISDRGYGW